MYQRDKYKHIYIRLLEARVHSCQQKKEQASTTRISRNLYIALSQCKWVVARVKMYGVEKDGIRSCHNRLFAVGIPVNFTNSRHDLSILVTTFIACPNFTRCHCFYMLASKPGNYFLFKVWNIRWVIILVAGMQVPPGSMRGCTWEYPRSF